MYILTFHEFKSLLLHLIPFKGTLHIHAATPCVEGVNGYQTNWLIRSEEGNTTTLVQEGNLSSVSEGDDLIVSGADCLLVALFDPTPTLSLVYPFARALACVNPNVRLIVFTTIQHSVQKELMACELLRRGAMHFCVFAEYHGEDVGRFALSWFLTYVRNRREALRQKKISLISSVYTDSSVLHP
ncbi:TPA: hypothetical protein DEP26_00555 [Candidatus Uhrbacteria bacterium]|nr:hypothetical protein [Candidatus Uhrbacteria bacterium]